MDAAAALVQLFDAVDRHARARASRQPERVRELAVEVAGSVSQLAEVHLRPARTALSEAPPRQVAVAFAQALFSASHVSRTLAVASTTSDAGPFIATNRLSEALGLPLWEIEDLRGENDRRASEVLKRARALNWLWSRFPNPRNNPQPLFNTLFQGAVAPVAERFARQGSRLYAVVPQPSPPPPEALYLRWLGEAEHWTCLPDNHFAARYVDRAIVRGLERGVGCQGDEADRILDNLVCTIPTEGERVFLDHDRWRSEGWAELTGLGVVSPGPDWLPLPLAPDAIDTDEWLVPTGDGLTLRSPRAVFDRHAMTRMTAMTQAIYAEMCARLLADRTDPMEQVWLFDLGRSIQRCLQPMVDWARAARTRDHVAAARGLPPQLVGDALNQAADAWEQSIASSWGGMPDASRPHTVQTILASHLAVTQSALQSAWRRPPGSRAPHRRVLLLFFAHYAAHAPLGRLWRPVDGQLPPPEDLVGQWFWGTWERVMAALAAEE